MEGDKESGGRGRNRVKEECTGGEVVTPYRV